MANVFVLNGHAQHQISPGKLNQAFTERAEAFFKDQGHEVRTTYVEQPFEIEAEIAKLKWADIVFLQAPVNWMGVSWAMKKYIDEIWTVGMMGELSGGDGRTAEEPKKNYGLAPMLNGTYMLSLTGNAPKEAFNDPQEKFFDGLSEDELMLPLHLNFKWIGLKPLPTFMAYDVLKNPDVESDFQRFDAHLAKHF
ncbi:NAD(P)H-dependent oxidoreductase [Streptomyces sp. NPDC048172]|uniref:NAD(P)H-dependent oxidoreductase n=1 Tax=Streptomyces sp. NPDC048172 TaxID=3365505 RepID=UPI00371676B5